MLAGFDFGSTVRICPESRTLSFLGIASRSSYMVAFGTNTLAVGSPRNRKLVPSIGSQNLPETWRGMSKPMPP